MIWKTYFLLFFIFSTAGIVYSYGPFSLWSVADWIEASTNILAIIGLYCFVFKKKLFSYKFWKVFFWILIINWIFNIIYVSTPSKVVSLPPQLESRSVSSKLDLLTGIFISSPMAYAIYKLGKKDT